ncbi:MAG TPA: PilZ domain-containing protein [Methylococcus sp.]|nr:PilZ domain-containing protein [Methylococcus sp.]
MPDFTERRRSPRIQVDYRVTYKVAGTSEERCGKCVNISGSGIRFETDEIIEPGRAVELRIEPDHPLTPPLTAHIEVLRCTPAPEPGRYHISGAFMGIRSD